MFTEFSAGFVTLIRFTSPTGEDAGHSGSTQNTQKVLEKYYKEGSTTKSRVYLKKTKQKTVNVTTVSPNHQKSALSIM